MCAVPAAAQLALRMAMVESPRWLAARGRDEESVAALATLGQPPLRSTRGDGSVQSAAVGYADLFKPRYARATSVAVGMNLLQQLCGINVVVYYAPSVLSSLGFTAAGSIAVTVAIGVLQIVAGFATSRAVDAVGRRVVARRGILGVGAGLSLLAVGGHLSGGGGAAAAAGPWVAVLGVFVFRVAFSTSLGPLPYVISSEAFPNDARAAGVSFATAANWLANAVVSGSFPAMVSSLGVNGVWGAYLLAVVPAYVATRAALPETRGTELEDVGEEEKRATATGRRSRDDERV